MKKFSALSTQQIRYLLIKYIKRKKCFVCAIDQLKLIKREQDGSLCGVINNEKKYQSGMHWLALYVAPKSNILEIFDSFAIPLKFYGKTIQNFAKKHKLNIVTNNFRVQSFKSVMCGYFSIFFLVNRANNISFQNIQKIFNPFNISGNENNVKTYFSKKFPILSNCTKSCFKKCKMNVNDLNSVCIQKNRKCNKLFSLF